MISKRTKKESALHVCGADFLLFMDRILFVKIFYQFYLTSLQKIQYFPRFIVLLSWHKSCIYKLARKQKILGGGCIGYY
ncbi:hypothetical protein M670_00004 [Schinkia azotoformans MEV2011]|uniref:Uncharacterized protein n=2 Tax=Schinkia azotoformans TaxID=1454 RepID=K6DR15_SCHAZ|nr:hypothetical protein BAZO_18326 [Schinkia azotoformans LMG 9581]KEF39994.1 hypothetical protein M670_00004 [Schinkia azotoformans MEV2011]